MLCMDSKNINISSLLNKIKKAPVLLFALFLGAIAARFYGSYEVSHSNFSINDIGIAEVAFADHLSDGAGTGDSDDCDDDDDGDDDGF